MKSVFKNIKNFLSKVFKGLEEKGKKEVESSEPPKKDSNKSPVYPGLEEKEEDVGKKVFEKTGRVREGIGQSSTREPQKNPVKSSHGVKHRSSDKKRHKKENDFRAKDKRG